MIAIDDRESEVVREAFLLYLRHRSVGKVRSELDRLGQRNRRESKPAASKKPLLQPMSK